ncbi:hamartin-like [Physella acuta]|uniref:hamartin-like n=1 Tax=Physella acuta TaxID=109671 RepID=UPI0027DDD223|nr:hamartin-like [Physella acuta]XP_059143508.1 hamartin-like [Physella acuta]
MASGGSLHMEDLLQFLESADTITDIKEIILENLKSTKETWLIPALVDYYYQTQSSDVQEILAELRDAQAKVLLDKLSDGLKSTENRIHALQLILFLVYKELPWCHLIMETQLFASVIKGLKQKHVLKGDLEVPAMMTSLMIVIILLPSVPVSMGPHLSTLFEIFGRLAILCVKKPASIDEVYFLHIQVALYSLFNRLYGMYPCTFIAYLNKFYSQKENIHVYEEVIVPMLERVRLHPQLVIGQKESETSSSRWKNQETQDIVVSCSKLSLDLIEGSWEDTHCPVFHSIQSVDKYRYYTQNILRLEKNKAATEPLSVPQNKKIKDFVSISSLRMPLDASAVGESPSVLIGLSTPPSSQRTTPAACLVETTTPTAGQTETPDLTPTPRLQTPCQIDDGEKTPSSGTKGLFQPSYDSRRPTVVAPRVSTTVPHSTPVTPGSYSVYSPATPTIANNDPSPISSKISAFSAPQSSPSTAIRSIQFIQPLAEKDELKTVSSVPEETAQQEEKRECVSVDALNHVISNISTPEIDTLDQEVEEINEREDKFDERNSPTSSITTLISQPDMTAESVRQFMKKVNRIRFNSLTSNSSSDYDTASLTHGSRHQNTRRPRSCPPFKRRDRQVTSEKVPSTRGRKQGDVNNAGQQPSDETCSNCANHHIETCKTCKAHQLAHESSVEVPPLPALVNPVFQYIFAPSKLAICSNCHQQLLVTSNQAQHAGTTLTTVKGNEVALFSTMSQSELLDRHIKLGSEIYAKELVRLPLTCKDSTNWTHFGGIPPVDEVNIVRGQVLLLHNQLMYERHKRTNHAKRNRRLLRRITNMIMLEEQQKTLLDQVRMHEQTIQQLNISVKLLQEENRKLKQSQESDEYEKLVQFRTCLKENKDLKASSVVLKNLLLTQKEDYDKQQKKLDNVQHQNLENEKELEICRERLANTEKLKETVFRLRKELLLLQELYQKCQEKLHQSRTPSSVKTEESYLINSLKMQIDDLTKENKKKTLLLDAYQTRAFELEEHLKTKDIAINDSKRNFEVSKSSHTEQLQAAEEHCKSMVHIIQQLEVKVMELTCQLDQAAHKKMMEARAAQLKSSANSGKTLEVSKQSPAVTQSQVEPDKTVQPDAKQDTQIASLDISKETASVVVASNTVSICSSTFVDDPPMQGSQPSFISGHFPSRDIDSGAASRSSFRGDSDISFASISEQSHTTKDSGCWPKE